jgi:translocation and assembly module TamB
MKKPRKYILAFITCCLVAFLFTTVLLAATAPGQRMVLRLAEWAASSDDLTLKIGELQGSLFSQGTISSLSVSDRDGRWAESGAIYFAWNPWALFSGTIEIDRLDVAKATISRTPRENADAASKSAQSGSGDGPLLLPLRIRAFSIQDALLGESILGQPARLSASGQIEALDPADTIFAAITVNDLDRPSNLQANLTYLAATDSLEVSATAADKAGGILSSLLDLSDRPDLRLTLNGAGPIGGWRGTWSLVAGPDLLAGGKLALDRQNNGMRIAAEAKGELSRFVPESYTALLAGNTDVTVDANISDDGGYQLQRFRLSAPRLTASASGSIDPEKSHLNGRAELRLNKNDDGGPVILTIAAGERLSVGEAAAVISAQPGQSGTVFTVQMKAVKFAAAGQQAEQILLEFSAHQPAGGNELFETLEAIRLSAAIDKPELHDPTLRPIAGDRITLDINGTKSGDRFTIDHAGLTTDTAKLSAKGNADEAGFKGDFQLTMQDASPLSGLAGRELSGALQLSASGRAGFDGTLDLTVNGRTERVTAGEDLVGKILSGQSVLNGKLVRHETGRIRFKDLAVETSAVKLSADGDVGGQSSAIKLRGRITELGKLVPESSGDISIEATLEGEGESQTVTTRLAADAATIRGQRLDNVSIGYEGSGGIETQRGAFTAQGTIGGAQLTGTGQIAIGGEAQAAVRNFTFALGENRITADAVLPHSGDASGNAQIQIADAGQLAAVLGLPMEGSAAINAQLTGTVDAPTLSLKADSAKLRIDTIQLTGLRGAFEAADLLANPRISGSSTVKSLIAAETRIDDLTLTAKPDAGQTVFAIRTRIDNRWEAGGEAVANLSNWAPPDAILRNLSLKNGPARLTQQGEARLSAAEGRFKLDNLVLKSGSGSILANVAMEQSLNGKVEITSFPASFAAVLTPGMEPRGTVDGTLNLSGTAESPEAAYKLSLKNAFVAGALPPSFPALNLSASGAFANHNLTIDAAVTGTSGLDLKANGALRGLTGGGTLDLKAKGTAPLGLAEAFLAARGTRLQGSAAIDLAISGPAAQPVINGRVTASGATVSDPESGLNLKDVALTARLSGKALQIEKLTAASEKGGTLNASGTIGIFEGKTLPIDLQIKANALRFDDQRIAAGELGSDLALKGSLNGESKLSGTIDIARLDIQIPQSLPSSVQALDLKHKNAPAHVMALQPPEEDKNETRLPSTIALALQLRSANRIFVKGRGLDALLGGSLQLLGSADQPRAVGEFTLERGRMAILGRTLEFTSGSVNFNGDLDPILNFLATTDVDGTRIEVTVTGQASNPKFGFSSNPELPEDEVLALLLFNKSLDKLSPFQIAQLATEISELTGVSGGPGVLGRLRSSVGLDTLNITTDEKGDAAVSAGSYLNENIFVGVEQGSSGDSSRVKVDLDVTKNIKLRGETGADGESKLGVGVEWEY